MIYKLFIFNKWKQTPLEFEATVQSYLTERLSVSELKVWEMSDGDVAVQLKLREEQNANEEFLFSTAAIESVEVLVNQTLESTARADKAITHLDVTTSGKSPRAIVAMIVGHSGRDNRTEGSEEKQDPTIDAEPKPGAEPDKRSRDRRASKRAAQRNR